MGVVGGWDKFELVSGTGKLMEISVNIHVERIVLFWVRFRLTWYEIRLVVFTYCL